MDVVDSDATVQMTQNKQQFVGENGNYIPCHKVLKSSFNLAAGYLDRGDRKVQSVRVTYRLDVLPS